MSSEHEIDVCDTYYFNKTPIPMSAEHKINVCGARFTGEKPISKNTITKYYLIIFMFQVGNNE